MLCSKQNKVSLEELKEWYNGYINKDGDSIYNPMSVCQALNLGECANYWGNSVPLNEITQYVMHDIAGIREYIIRLAAGETIEMELLGYESENPKVNNINLMLSLMVIGGFLAYHNKKIFIPKNFRRL